MNRKREAQDNGLLIGGKNKDCRNGGRGPEAENEIR